MENNILKYNEDTTTYGLNICVENGTPKGIVTGNINYSFDPRIVLCELRYDINKNLLLQENNFMFDDCDYKIEYAFNSYEPFGVDKRDKYVAVVSTIIKLIKESETKRHILDLHILEFLRSFFDLRFEFTPSIQLPNTFKIPKSNISDSSKKIKAIINNRSALSHNDLKKEIDSIINSDDFEKEINSIFTAKEYYEYTPKEHPYKEISVNFYHYDFRKALSCNIDNFHNYFYKCYSHAEVIVAIFHFLTLNNYKFRKCEHCGKYFATKSLKQKYCYRKSPYKGYEHLDCNIAVKNIMQSLRRKRRSILKNLDNNQPLKKEKFLKKSADLIDITKENSNIKNIDKAFDYINKDRWYKRKHNPK